MNLQPARSSFASVDALHRTNFSGDVSVPGVLQQALRLRVHRGELILFTFDYCDVPLALNLVLHLRRHLQLEHFLPLSDGPRTCAAMQEAVGSVAGAVPCFWSAYPSNHSGWPGNVGRCESAQRGQCAPEVLWATRYFIAGRILARGDVSLLHIDTDTLLLTDPYPALKAAPASLLIVPEAHPANGGVWYAQRTGAGGAAHWVISEVARRTVELLAANEEDRHHGLPPFDQALHSIA